ncbi:hypothetical protein AMELA_G00119140 [Ameiurus melas]|uniref:Secreted protein n=1 Tax=Ameiurus melas TaxID=219545 RepID=A0A7J6ANK1_AMEME|nr:hypothetical protein AMELA_G00119140 [Ameiurus melas]
MVLFFTAMFLGFFFFLVERSHIGGERFSSLSRRQSHCVFTYTPSPHTTPHPTQRKRCLFSLFSFVHLFYTSFLSTVFSFVCLFVINKRKPKRPKL